MRCWRWATPGLLVVEIGLVLTGVLPVATALVVFFVVEALLGAAAIGQLAVAVRTYLQYRGGGLKRGPAVDAALRHALPRPAVVLVEHEARLWQSLWLWVRRRRHGVPEGATAIGYGASSTALGLGMLAATVAEVVVIELVVPWSTVRIVLLVLSVWSVLFLLGLVAAPWCDHTC